MSRKTGALNAAFVDHHLKKAMIYASNSRTKMLRLRNLDASHQVDR
jgi:hypothetical protein